MVSHDPSVEEMKKIVILEGSRPALDDRWKNDNVRGGRLGGGGGGGGRKREGGEDGGLGIERNRRRHESDLPPSPSPFQSLSVLSSVMQECWRLNPSARLTAFRIKKKLAQLCTEGKNGYKH